MIANLTNLKSIWFACLFLLLLSLLMTGCDQKKSITDSYTPEELGQKKIIPDEAIADPKNRPFMEICLTPTKAQRSLIREMASDFDMKYPSDSKKCRILFDKASKSEELHFSATVYDISPLKEFKKLNLPKRKLMI